MRQKIKLMAIAILVALGATIPALAQASGSTAEVRGQVTDSTNAVIPGAKITLTDVNKGTARTATTDAEGNYSFLGLLPSAYDLKVEAKGFTSSSTRLELTVGQQANIPFQLGTGSLEVKVDIVAGAEVVETTRSQQSSVVDAKQIVNLPISRRNYLDYALLTPGVTDSDNIADASDFRVAQTPQSGLSFGGSNGRGNLVSVDGGETLGSSGGVVNTLGQEAVQEFQVVRNSFSAEFGGASGGVVNIISKSGSNSWHGSAFGLFRDQRFDARNPFDFNPKGKSSFNRQQYGGSIGGPIKTDKTFIFSTIERFTQQETTFVNLLNDPNIFNPTALQNSIFTDLNTLGSLQLGSLTAAQLSGALRGALTTTAAAYPRTVNLFTNASGQFPFDSYQTAFSVRADHNFNDRSNGYLRVFVNDSNFQNQAAGALTAVSRGRALDTFNHGILASHNYQISSSLLNELKLQYAHTTFSVIPNDPNGPEINIEGFGFFGRDIFLGSKTKENHYDIYDNLSKVAGNHTFKFGGSLFFWDVYSNSETFFGGRFSFGANIPLSSVIGLNPALGPAVLGALGAPAGANEPASQVALRQSVFARLAVPVNALQAYNFNLPAVFQGGFGDPAAHSWTNRYAAYAQDTWRVNQKFTLNYGLRYQIHDEPFFMPTRYKDFQPRAGFAWDLFGNGKTAIRGGAGIFVGTVNNAVANVTTELSGMGSPDNINIVLATATSNALGLPTSFTIYQTLLARGILGTRPIAASDLAGAPINLTPRAGAPLEVRFRVEPNYENPKTYQASFGLQQDLGKGFSLDASYLYTRGLFLTRNRDVNQFKLTGPVNPLNPLGGPTFIRFPSAAQAQAGLTSDFRNPLRFQDNVYESSASSFYHALTLQVQKRFANNFSLNAHYTLSKAIDEVTDFNSDFSAQNPLNLRLDRALSAFDQRHRAVFSGTVVSTLKNPILRDWLFSPIFVAGSGRPFNLLLGFDGNGDGRSQSDRPGQAGRNTGTGENFYSFDMRLARRFFVKESRFLELTFEAFNLFNRTNFAGINNIIGGACVDGSGNIIACTTGSTPLTNFDARGNRTKRPTEPLGFTSAADARKLQFGVRFNF
ncbi:MAG TPA: TonB-dependent receptor [Blastocatellia bacterium]|nr:TonB-dependent receptor [Blastocatellia bacterium]HMZ17700.1 TonB-dependent receptor [Blastocatellia bacterium]HNG33238.1 TonB-dependent receptor [Blastocatellia bacterium]